MAGMPGTAFLFGAGASYGSDIQGVPPLGAGLFDELRRFNPDAWGLISGDLATLFRSDFEEGIKSIAPTCAGPPSARHGSIFFRIRAACLVEPVRPIGSPDQALVGLVRRSVHIELRTSARALAGFGWGSTLHRSAATRKTRFRTLPAARLLSPIL
jgi:hypothetical protein